MHAARATFRAITQFQQLDQILVAPSPPSPVALITATACSRSVLRNTVPNALHRAPTDPPEAHGVGGVDEAEPRQAPAAATGLRVAAEDAIAVEPAHALDVAPAPSTEHRPVVDAIA